jgi:phage gpG-like protein
VALVGSDQVRVEGETRLAATLKLAAVRVTDQSAAGGKAASLVATRGRATAPTRTGRLAGSLTTSARATEAEITSGLAYAARTHWGYRRYAQAPQPFLADPAEQLQPVWSGYYLASLNRLLATVKGA